MKQISSDLVTWLVSVVVGWFWCDATVNPGPFRIYGQIFEVQLKSTCLEKASNLILADTYYFSSVYLFQTTGCGVRLLARR